MLIISALIIVFNFGQATNYEQSNPKERDENQALVLNSEQLNQTESNRSSAGNQSDQFQAQLTMSIERFRDLPFRPEYGKEVFEKTRKLSDTEREKWLRHCRLRDAYSSEHIRDPAFLEVYELATHYELDEDIVNLCYLYDIASGLTSVVLHTTDYSPELVSKERQEDLQELLQEQIEDYRKIIANIYKREVPDEFMKALMEIHPSGAIGDPSTHIEPGERIILN